LAHVIERVLAGGFPEALTRSDPVRRRTWLINFARSLASRDVLDITEVPKAGMKRVLTDPAAFKIEKLLNRSDLGQRVDFLTKTIDRWILLLENVCLLVRLRPWHRSEIKRLVKTPKLQMINSGLPSALREIDEGVISRDRTVLGPLLECFVYSQSRKVRGLTADNIRVGLYESCLSFKLGVSENFGSGHPR
jgi:predicted AAA+ superfamily ATPase